MPTTDTIKRYLNVKEAAEYLGLSRHTIYRMIKNAVIPCTSFGRIVRFDRQRLDKWVEERSIQGKV